MRRCRKAKRIYFRSFVFPLHPPLPKRAQSRAMRKRKPAACAYIAVSQLGGGRTSISCRGSENQPPKYAATEGLQRAIRGQFCTNCQVVNTHTCIIVPQRPMLALKAARMPSSTPLGENIRKSALFCLNFCPSILASLSPRLTYTHLGSGRQQNSALFVLRGRSSALRGARQQGKQLPRRVLPFDARLDPPIGGWQCWLGHAPVD